jgi:cell division transport system permease protein
MRLYYVLRYFVREAFHNLWANRFNNIVSIAIIAFSVFTVGMFLLTAENLGRLMGQWTEDVHVNVFLKDSADPVDSARVETIIKSSPAVRRYEYISREQAVERFRSYYPSMADLTNDLPSNPFPPSFEISIRKEFQNRAAVEQMVDRLRVDNAVVDVEYDQDWIDRLQFIIRSVRIIGLGFGGILIFTAMFSISNVIKLIVLSRRDEIEIMRLVGATNSFIKGPFLTEGILHGMLGGVLALLLLYATYGLVMVKVSNLGAFYGNQPLHFLSGWFLAAVLSGGMIVGFFGSLFSLTRLLRI